MIEIKNCQICSEQSFKKVFELKDYFLSKEDFNIVKCENCGFLFTNPQPHPENLGDYYKSEEYVSHSNSKKGFVNSAYHIVRNYTLNKKFKMVKSIMSKGSILDIGCATGEFLNVFKLDKWTTLGIEPDKDAKKFAVENYNLNIENENYLENIDENSFDIITMWHVLEHVPNLNKRLETLNKILKDDGNLIIAVPNYKSYDADYYGKFWAAYDVPRHLFHFSKSTMEKLLIKHGFQIENIKPMKFDSFYVSMLSEKYKNQKSNILNAFWVGLKSNFKAIKSNDYSSLIYIVKKV
jgi:2-polyprenyl-3-methyl-5-hydroxy-6-metoxy-1,4-benzoquinol methylase